MKKSMLFTLLALVLAVCTLIGVMAFSASAAEADHPHSASATHCVCGGSNEFCANDHSTTEVTWSAWTGTETDGYYYLTGDITVSTALKIGKDANLYLCLNGYTITVDGVRLFELAGTNRSLNICDCSENQTGTITTNNTKASGTLILASYGTVNLYGGNYINNAESTVYGFIRVGGTSSTTTYSGEINMYGGKIQGNTMTQGGSVYIVKNCTFNMNGGQIVGGHSTNTGGNVYCAGTFNMSGGSISGGVSDSGNSGNMYITADGTLKMTGGSIAGKVVNAGKVSVGKDAVINETGLFFTGAGNIVLNAGMNDGSMIQLASNTKSLTIPTTNPLNADNFAAPAGKAFAFDPDAQTQALELVDAHAHCACGQKTHLGDCKGQTVTYNIWKGTTTLPTGGNWCLENHVTLEAQGNVGSSTAGQDMALCLNGKTVTGGENKRVLMVRANSSLILSDCVGTGSLQCQGAYADNAGHGIYTGSNTVTKIYGGTITGGNTTDATGEKTVNGGNISGYGELYLYGGTITGGTSADLGGGVYFNGSITLGGNVNITGNSGSNLYLQKGKTLTVADDFCGNVGITMAQPGVFADGGEALTACFTSDNAGYQVACVDGQLQLGSLAHTHCVCGGLKPEGHTCEDVVYQAWTADMETAPTSGNWYLAENVNQEGITLSGNMNICLNGHTWDAGSTKRAILLGTTARTLNVTDCCENGTITGSFGGAQGKLIYAQNGTANLYGGTYTNTNDATRQNGGVVSLGYKGSTKTYAGTLNVYAATLTGTLAQDGGVIHLSNGSQANIYDSVLNTGDSYRGAINVLAGCGLSIQDSTINGTENKTGIWNCGTMIAGGNVVFTNCAPNIMVDYRDGNQPTMDVSGLNVTTPITLRRYEVDSVNDDAGLLAQNATEAQLAMLAAYNPGYYLSVAEGNVYLNDCAVQSFAGTDIVGGGATLDEALAAENTATWYVLNTDQSGQTVSKNTIVDLNGHDLSDLTIAEGVQMVLLDTTTEDFDCSDGYGVVTLSENSKGTIANNTKTATADVGFVQHYVVIPAADGSYSSHRFYAFITSVSLDPANAALGYKATFQGDDVVRSVVTGYGYNLWVNDGTVKTYAKDGAFANKQVVSLRVKNILSEGNDALNAIGATATINGNAFISFNLNGTELTVDGTSNSTTLKSVVEAVDSAVADYTDAQMTAVQTMVNKFASYMDGWAISNITDWKPAEEA